MASSSIAGFTSRVVVICLWLFRLPQTGAPTSNSPILVMCTVVISSTVSRSHSSRMISLRLFLQSALQLYNLLKGNALDEATSGITWCLAALTQLPSLIMNRFAWVPPHLRRLGTPTLQNSAPGSQSVKFCCCEGISSWRRNGRLDWKMLESFPIIQQIVGQLSRS